MAVVKANSSHDLRTAIFTIAIDVVNRPEAGTPNPNVPDPTSSTRQSPKTLNSYCVSLRPRTCQP